MLSGGRNSTVNQFSYSSPFISMIITGSFLCGQHLFFAFNKFSLLQWITITLPPLQLRVRRGALYAGYYGLLNSHFTRADGVLSSFASVKKSAYLGAENPQSRAGSGRETTQYASLGYAVRSETAFLYRKAARRIHHRRPHQFGDSGTFVSRKKAVHDNSQHAQVQVVQLLFAHTSFSARTLLRRQHSDRLFFFSPASTGTKSARSASSAGLLAKKKKSPMPSPHSLKSDSNTF